MTLPIEAGTWTLDAAHSQLNFSVRHLGISTVRGFFRAAAGKAVIGADGSVALDVTVEVKSIDSANEARDGHLQSPQFFDGAAHPTITFHATSVDLAASKGVVKGDITIKGITKPLELQVAYNGSATFPMDGSLHAGFEATGTILRTEFDMGFGVPMVTDAVALSLEVQLVRQVAAA